MFDCCAWSTSLWSAKSLSVVFTRVVIPWLQCVEQEKRLHKVSMNSQQTKQRRQLKSGSWLERISDWCSGRRKAKWTRKDSRGRRDTKSCAWKLLKFPAGEREGTAVLGVHRCSLHLIRCGMFSLLPSKLAGYSSHLAVRELKNPSLTRTHTHNWFPYQLAQL